MLDRADYAARTRQHEVDTVVKIRNLSALGDLKD